MNADKMFHLDVGYCSDRGVRRDDNQDSFLVYPESSYAHHSETGALFTVADGMGGHAEGKAASQTAIDCIQEIYSESSDKAVSFNLREAYSYANRAIFERARQGGFDRMGTTCSTLVLHDSKFTIAHVGDSRIYQIRKDDITRLTSDHTQVAELERNGMLSKEEAEQSLQKGVLTRALGVEETVKVDVLGGSYRDDDIFVLITDGLASVSEDEIKKMVIGSPPQTACDRLVELEKERSGHDNITVIVARPKPFRAMVLSPQKRLALYSAIVVSLLASAGLFLFFQQNWLQQKPEEVRMKTAPPQAPAKVESNSPQLLSPLPEQEDKLDMARAKVQSREYQSAIAVYKEILADNPKHTEAIDGMARLSDVFEKQGDSLLVLDKLGSSLLVYKQAFDLSPNKVDLWGKINKLQNRLDMASETVAPELTIELTIEVPPSDSVKKADLKNDEIGLPRNISGFQPADWMWSDLSDSGIVFVDENVLFSQTDSAKKIVSNFNLADVEVNFKIDSLAFVSSSDEIVFLFGVDAEESLEIQISGENQVVIVQKSDSSKTVISTTELNLSYFETEPFDVAIRSLGSWLMLNIPHHPPFAWSGEKIIQGAFGIYASAPTKVMFTDFKVVSVLGPADQRINK